MEEPPGYTASNRVSWDAQADAYQAEHGPQLDTGGAAWGIWQLPEAELGILGDIVGKDVLEYGCGAATFSIGLAKRGARPVGLDISERQLAHARDRMRRAGVSFPLIAANGEATGLADESFDIVFSDHGATTFCDPMLAIPEVVRLLRPGGLFAFNGMTPLVELTWEQGASAPGRRLVADYHDLHRIQGEGGEVFFTLPYGDWVRLFVANGLEVVDLIEPRPDPDATSTFWDDEGRDWARRWPAEQLWSVRKRR